MISAASRASAVAACGLTLSLFAACSAPPDARAIELSGPTMGTRWSVTLVPGRLKVTDEERARIDRRVRDRLVSIERLLSTWQTDSELSRFNRSRSTEPFAVSPDTYDVFRWAATLSQETENALNVTVLPIVHAWGFGAGGDPAGPPPDDDTLVHLRARTGMHHLELDPERGWIRKRRPDVECDLGAIAPGYAADRVADLLAEDGLSGFLIDVGGELVARGRNAEGQAWRVAVEQPEEHRGRFARVVELDGLAIATSGSYRTFREVNGVRMSHIIDPRTGRPIRHSLASVTVVDRFAVRADALATALMVLGPEEGMSLARTLNLPALFIVATRDGFEQRATPGFEALTRAS